MDQKNGNFLSAIFLCMIVLLGWQYFVVEPKLAAERARQAELQKLQGGADGFELRKDADVVAPDANGLGVDALNAQQGEASIDIEFADSPRLSIQTPELSGSIALMGARFDDIELNNFPTSLAENAPSVRLLEHSTLENNNTWQASYGWNSADGNPNNMPNSTTLWTIESGTILTPDSPVTIKYEAPNGLIFRQHISVDAHYMFTVKQSVENTSETAFTLFPFGRITRLGEVPDAPIFVLHEGGVGVFGAEHGSEEISYGDLREDPAFDMTTTGGWLGLTDKYWAAALIPPQDEVFRGRLIGKQSAKGDAYNALYSLAPKQLVSGGQIETTGRLFAGAKQVNLIDNYNDQDILKFDLMIDWGWFYFLTKPMFKLLALFYDIFGNYGVSILIVTILIKLVFFPLANKSYVTMAKMKKLQPEMMRIRDVYADDKMQQQQEMMKLYREEKLNPLAGCLPILI
ncbi:MAG: membrane protein insertase YidC, partial [Pseudomonadota bacterium]|nr:membrane protein insertase YidC [Pseudomonadota bacterium]